ncbi:hypothetical protein J6590_096098, partial [Homalodisca vitripennis]
MKLADKCRLFDSLRAASEISKQARQKKRSSNKSWKTKKKTQMTQVMELVCSKSIK